MTYVKKTWVNGSRGGTPITAEDLNRMEDGIAGVFRSQAITTGTIDLGTMNEWTVANPVQITLPPASPPFACTVHVKTGFQKITWPNGTLIVGETTENDVWVTLLRLPTGWVVLIPSGGGGSGLIDTRWINVLNAANLGAGVQVFVGDASMIKTGWTVSTATMISSVDIRRSGNSMYVRITGGFTRTTGGGSAMLWLPGEGMLPEYGLLDHNVVVAGGVKVPATYQANIIDQGSGTPPPRHLEVSLVGVVAEGTLAKPEGLLQFLIDPASTWGD